ncbi:MAG: beta-ketoacyl synthase chain length factor [Gammaproteobacteria bacterium]|nr:beta-ketoacyl synthase chain length factor [Gammaproteobacteria bacterium]
MKVYIENIALYAPGLDGWPLAKKTLASGLPFDLTPLEPYKPKMLPRNETRRSSSTVKMAFRIGEELVQESARDFSECAAVFVSSGGDYAIIDQICGQLCTEEKHISPTRFHNSVHNAPAGYWAIAARSHKLSISISAYDDSFLFGLLEALSVCESEQVDVLYIAYDMVPPFPLASARKITHPFATGMLLTPYQSDDSAFFLSMAIGACEPENKAGTRPGAPLMALYEANPIARSLPLLELLAQNRTGDVLYCPTANDTGQCYSFHVASLKGSGEEHGR